MSRLHHLNPARVPSPTDSIFSEMQELTAEVNPIQCHIILQQLEAYRSQNRWGSMSHWPQDLGSAANRHYEQQMWNAFVRVEMSARERYLYVDVLEAFLKDRLLKAEAPPHE